VPVTTVRIRRPTRTASTPRPRRVGRGAKARRSRRYRASGVVTPGSRGVTVVTGPRDPRAAAPATTGRSPPPEPPPPAR
jgi:hypothetical protein